MVVMVRACALLVCSVLFAWTSLVYRKLRTTRHGMMWLPLKLFAGTFALETSAVGMVGTALGIFSGSASLAVSYALLGLAAGIPLVRTWRTREVFTATFGALSPEEGRRRYLVKTPWGLRLPVVPEARVLRDVPFWTAAEPGRRLVCDIWQPARDVPASGLGLIYLHGSAWMLLDKDCGTASLFRHLAAQGHVVMDIAYRLYPETDIVGMVADAKHAVAWLKAQAGEFGVDADCIVLGGASAGGHIAILSAYTNQLPALTPADLRDSDTSVSGAIGWYSPVDLAACYQHYENAALAAAMPDKPDWNAPPPSWMRQMLGADTDRLHFQKAPTSGRLDWIVGGTPQEIPHRYALLSPIAHARIGCPPTLLMQGRDDIIVPPGPAFELQQRLGAAGVKSAVLILPHADHAFDLAGTNWSPMARLALWHAERFLAVMARGARRSCRGIY